MSYRHARVPRMVGTTSCGPALPPLVSSREGTRCKGDKKMHVWTRSMAAALLATGWHLSTIPEVKAQAQAPVPGPSEPSPSISDQKLDAAAAALERLTSVHQDYRQRMAAAAPSDRERIADEATGALKKAVTDQGLSVEEYSSIVEVAKKDPETRRKLLQRMRPQTQ
ncbi:MAG: DUF4168 domain-containing protein [Rhizobiales bacterium]|nr:DUF4168 domain-containing protein [Hyphomicrobiales bacterium]